MATTTPPTEKGVVRHLNDYAQKHPNLPVYKLLALHAREKNMWLYDKSKKRWYTPEEFVDLCEFNPGADYVSLASIEVRNPLEGIEAAHRQIKNINDRLEMFTKKLMNYIKGS